MNFCEFIKINGRRIGKDEKTFIIAEAGVNHNGNMTLAKQMIDAAVEAGVDAVKFQTFKTDKLILKNIDKAPYQKVTTNSNETQYDMLKHLEVTKEQTAELMGVTPMYYARFENNNLTPSKRNLDFFADFLEMDKDELWNIIEEEKKMKL